MVSIIDCHHLKDWAEYVITKVFGLLTPSVLETTSQEQLSILL